MTYRARGVSLNLPAFVLLTISVPISAQDPTGPRRGFERLTIAAGALAEQYSGNLSAVTATVVDSTESAGAAIGEFGANATYEIAWAAGRTITLTADAGLRQSAATGLSRSKRRCARLASGAVGLKRRTSEGLHCGNYRVSRNS